MEKPRQASLNITPDLKYSNGVRSFVSAFLLAEEVPEGWARRLILVLDELFMNAVRYGTTPEGIVQVSCAADEEKVSFTVRDDGTGKSKITAAELQSIVQKKGEEMTHHKTSGRGLSIITSSWADLCEADDNPEGGISIRIIKYRKNLTEIKRAAPAPAAQSVPPVAAAEVQPAPVVPVAKLEIRVVPFLGSIDESNLSQVSNPVYDLLADSKPFHLILDFSKLDYFNSLFVGTLANWQTKLSEKGGRLSIIGATTASQEILDLCGLSEIIKLYPDLFSATNN